MNKNNLLIGLLIVIIVLLGYLAFKPKSSSIVTPQPITPIIDDSKNNAEPIKPISNNDKVKVYVEKDTTGDILAGARGDQVRLMASSTIPATITYTIKFSSGAVYPNAKIEEEKWTDTVSVKAGKTILDTFNAIDSKVDVNFSYVDNSNKSTAEITPAVKTDTKLTLDGTIGDANEFLNSNITHYSLTSRSNVEATVTYTLKYTPVNTSKEQIITKTIFVPVGTKYNIESITTATEPVLTFEVK